MISNRLHELYTVKNPAQRSNKEDLPLLLSVILNSEACDKFHLVWNRWM